MAGNPFMDSLMQSLDYFDAREARKAHGQRVEEDRTYQRGRDAQADQRYAAGLEREETRHQESITRSDAAITREEGRYTDLRDRQDRLDKEARGEKAYKRLEETRQRQAAAGFMRAAAQLEAMRDPSRRKMARAMRDLATTGQQDIVPGITHPDILDYLNSLHSDRLAKGVGDKVHGSEDVITDKRIGDLMFDAEGGDFAIELDVGAKRPDGTPYRYRAAATDGATSDPKSRVTRVNGKKASDQLADIGDVAEAIDQYENPDGAIDAMWDAMAANAAEAGVDLDKLLKLRKVRGGGVGDAEKNMGAMGKDLNYLARTYAGGDKTKAVALYKELRSAASKQKNLREDLVKMIVQANNGKAPTDLAERVTTLERIAKGSEKASSGPAPGTIEDGFRFKGGNPADQSSWERVE